MQIWLKTLFRNSFFQVGIGLFVTMIFGGFVLQWLETGDISKGNNPFWWAIVTMTTVGYGDFSPETTEGRLFAVFIMFAGITLVSLLTASISSIFVAQKIREGKGLEKLNLDNHIVLCGWNINADKLINSIYELKSDNKNFDLVLVNELSEEDITQLKSKFAKIRIHFVAGDFTQEETLHRASITTSNSVIVIPNNLNNDNESHDEKTIFATLTIKSIDSSIRVVAYILDRENLTHIKRAEADEVVVSDDFSLNIVGEYFININHQLMVFPGTKIEDLKFVSSHPMALLQCKKFLRRYPHITLVEEKDTADVAKQISEKKIKDTAAIASIEAAEIFGLEIISSNIQTIKNNETRFVIVSKELSKNENLIDKASLKFSLSHETGSLASVLSILKDYNLNLTKIQSLPIVEIPWKYSFFVDTTFSSIENFNDAIKLIKNEAESLKVLGLYKNQMK